MGKEAKNNGRKVAKKARIPTISGFKKFVRETFPSHSYEINKDATIVKKKMVVLDEYIKNIILLNFGMVISNL